MELAIEGQTKMGTEGRQIERQLIEQRDEFERLMHDEVDLSNKFYWSLQEMKERKEELEKEIQRLKNRNLFQRIFNL